VAAEQPYPVEYTSSALPLLDEDCSLKYSSAVLTWKLCSASDQVKVWAATVGDNPWEVVCGRTVVAASLEQLTVLLTDNDRRSSWDKQLRKTHVYRAVHQDRAVPVSKSPPSLADARVTVDSTAVVAAELKTLVYAGVWPVADRR
jgi:hypothetical protein